MRKTLLSILFTVTTVGCSDNNFVALGSPCMYDEDTGQLMLYQHPPKLPIPAPPDGTACQGSVETTLDGRIPVKELHRSHYLNRPIAPQPTPTQLQESTDGDVTRVHRQIYWESYQPLQPLWDGPPSEREEAPRHARVIGHDTRTLKRLQAVTASCDSVGESYTHPMAGTAGTVLSALPAPHAPETAGGCNLPSCRSKATTTSYSTPTPDGIEWESEVIEAHYSQYLMQRRSLERVIQPTPVPAASLRVYAEAQGVLGSQHEPDRQVTLNRILPLGVENLDHGATKDRQPIVTSGAGGTSLCPCDCEAKGRVNSNKEMQVMTVTSTIIITTTVVMPWTSLASGPTLAPIVPIM